MTVLDLCCGRGGWSRGFQAEGWETIGVDVVDFESYPGTVWRFDVRTLTVGQVADMWGPIDAVVASPPCQEFSRHSMPWTRARNPPPPDVSIWRACERLAADMSVPLVLENVRGAQAFMGPPVSSAGPFFFWGSGVPALVGYSWGVPKSSRGSGDVSERAEIPVNLARWFGRALRPVPSHV